MVETETPEKTEFKKLFRSRKAEARVARFFLLRIEEAYIQADQYYNPSTNESLDTEFNVKFVDIDPDCENSAGRYLAESNGKTGAWKAVVRRDGEFDGKTPQTYEFESITGDWQGLYRYMVDAQILERSDLGEIPDWAKQYALRR